MMKIGSRSIHTEVKMPIRRLRPYSIRARVVGYVDDLTARYVQQCIRDLKDTLTNLQRRYDEHFPGLGYGVALAAHDIELPYQPISDDNSEPAPGFYPEDFIPPTIYVVNIRPERAEIEGCPVIPMTVFINSVVVPIKHQGRILSEEGSTALFGFWGLNILRYREIKLFAQNESGFWEGHHFSEFLARVHQHQTDSTLGIEYLTHLHFTPSEMAQLTRWLNAPITGKTDIVRGKLQCGSDGPDIDALKAWAALHANMFQTRQNIQAIRHSGRKVIVVGASRGLGLAFVRYYLRHGYPVIAIHRASSDSSALKVYQEKYPDMLSLVCLDVTQEREVSCFAENLMINPGDIIIYNVGIKGYQGSDKSLEESDASLRRSEFDLNFNGQFLLSRYLGHKLAQSNVLWVYISRLTNADIDGLSTSCANFTGLGETYVYNMYIDLVAMWHKVTLDPKDAPFAFSVCPGWEKHNASYHADSDQIVRNIEHNCMVPLLRSKMPGVYTYSGECKHTYQKADLLVDIDPPKNRKFSSRSIRSVLKIYTEMKEEESLPRHHHSV